MDLYLPSDNDVRSILDYANYKVFRNGKDVQNEAKVEVLEIIGDELWSLQLEYIMKNKLVFLLFVLLFFTSQEIKTCTCVGNLKVKDKLKKADLIVVGKVLNSHLFDVIDTLIKDTLILKSGKIIKPQYLKNHYINYKVEVKEIIKGVKKTNIIHVISTKGAGTCGSMFSHDEIYVLYLKKENLLNKNLLDTNNVYTTNLCLGNTIEVEAELKKIRKYLKFKERQK